MSDLTDSALDPSRDSSGLYHSDQISAVALLRAKRHWLSKHSRTTVCDTAKTFETITDYSANTSVVQYALSAVCGSLTVADDEGHRACSRYAVAGKTYVVCLIGNTCARLSKGHIQLLRSAAPRVCSVQGVHPLCVQAAVSAVVKQDPSAAGRSHSSQAARRTATPGAGAAWSVSAAGIAQSPSRPLGAFCACLGA
jgi:hypothetical protein